MSWKRWPGWWWVQGSAALLLGAAGVYAGLVSGWWWGSVANAFFMGMVANAMLYRPLVTSWKRMVDDSHEQIGRGLILIGRLLDERDALDVCKCEYKGEGPPVGQA